MRIDAIRLQGIRCFDDTGLIELSSSVNIFIGQNNAGKSTLLRSLLALQGTPFSYSDDMRKTSTNWFHEARLVEVSPTFPLRFRPNSNPSFDVVRVFGAGQLPPLPHGFVLIQLPDDNPLFHPTRPSHAIVPFLARRKTQAFDQNVNQGAQNAIAGNLSNLYSRIDLVATAGHPKHEDYKKAIAEIVGIPITTKASPNGKEAGFYFDDDTFVTLDRMGDGVTEMVALIVELCLASGKIFVLEEPETNLHPKGLKALLAMVRSASETNQFVIATHSNIVVRELGSEGATKVFRVFREDETAQSPSHVEEVPRDASARLSVLRDLGYEFADMELHDAWLFLEESSAEQILEEILIPQFTPSLRGRLRTFSAGGVTNIEPRVSEFQRLVTFIHLQPAYQGHIWIRADGDEIGVETIGALRGKFAYLNEDTCAVFSEASFEKYYPVQFAEEASAALGIVDKQARRAAKAALLLKVKEWSLANLPEAREAWATSAAEIIAFLGQIEASLA